MKRLLLLLIPVMALGATACAPVMPYAAIVNGHVISNSQINDEIKAITGNARYSQLLDQELSAGGGAGGLQPDGKNTVTSTYTAQLVYNRVLVSLIDDTIAREHITPTAAEKASALSAVQQDAGGASVFSSLPQDYQSYLVDREANLTAILNSRNTPAKQQQYYNQNSSQFVSYCVQHILVGTQQQAQDIYTQLKNGGDFAALAKADSLDTGSAPQGGSLGCLTGTDLQQYVPAFSEQVLGAMPGVVTQPFSGQFSSDGSVSYDLLEVTSKTQQTFAEAQPTISQTLGSQSSFFSDVLQNAKVNVNPRYGDYVPSVASTGAVGHIVPHPAATVGAAAAAASAGAASGGASTTPSQ